MQKNNNLEKQKILSIEDMHVSFVNPEGVILAVDGISFDLYEGEVLGIVGESGSGKSVTALTMTHLIESSGMEVQGKAIFDGKDLLAMEEEEINPLRGPEISFVFQNPMSSLNPVMKIGHQIAEGPLNHGLISKKEAKEYAVDLMNKVGIKDAERRYHDYPHQFSGGMRQRVMIAIAIACKPKLLICDEPTTALDVTVERQILDLLMELKDSLGISIIMITHNLSLAMNYCDRIAVMLSGQIMEIGSAFHILSHPMHPYTRGLFGANLEIGKGKRHLDSMRELGGQMEDLPEGSLIIPHGVDIPKRGEMIQVEADKDHWYNTLYSKEFQEEASNDG